MSSNYQLLNQNFISSELYYLPLNSTIGKILTCKDNLGEFQWSNINSIMVSEIKSSDTNIMVNNTNNIYQRGQVELKLNTTISGLNDLSTSQIYTDNIYEKILNNNINFHNNLKMINGNILVNIDNNSNNIGQSNFRFSNIYGVNMFSSLLNSFSLYCDNIYEKSLSSSITLHNNLKLNSNGIISLGDTSNRFDTIWSNNFQCSNLVGFSIFVDNIYEKTVGNNINIYHDVKLNNSVDILVLNDNQCNIGSLLYRFQNIYSINIHSTNLYGQIRDNSQQYITTLNNLIEAGNLENINSNNILPKINNTISLGSSIRFFLNGFFTNIFSITQRTTNLYTNNIFEQSISNGIQIRNNMNLNSNNISNINDLTSNKLYVDEILEKTINSKIKIFNDLVLQDKNIEFKTDNASFIGSNVNKLNNIHTSNINITNIIANSSNINIIGNLKPDNNNLYSIGTSSFYFNNSYFTNSNITNNYSQNLYIDEIYEKTSSNNININDTIDMKNNDLKNVNNLYISVLHSTTINDVEIKSNIDMNSKYITGLNYINFGQSNLNYYEEGQMILNYTRGFTGSITIDYIKIGKIVTLMFQSDSISRTVVNDYVEFNSIPSSLRPRFTIFKSAIYGSDNSNASVLSIAIESNGNCILGNSLTNIFSAFTAGTVIAGFYAFDITYFVS
jgi:hypothetical protein